MLRVAILCAAAAGAHAFAADGAAALNFTRVGGLLTDEEVRLVRSLLPADDDSAWGLCPTQHEPTATKQCTVLPVAADARLPELVRKVGAAFGADTSEYTGFPIARSRPGAPATNPHHDKNRDVDWHPAATILVYLSTAKISGSGELRFDDAGIAIRPEAGTAIAFSTATEDTSAPTASTTPHAIMATRMGHQNDAASDTASTPTAHSTPTA